MSREKKEEYDLNEISKKLHEDSKTKEILICPKCRNQLTVQRSKDWLKLYAVYCPQCGFGMKSSYGIE